MLFILSYLFLLFGCKPADFGPPPIRKPFVPVYKNCDSTLQLIWQIPVLKDTALVSASLYEIDNQYIYNILPYNAKNVAEMGFFKISPNGITATSRLIADESIKLRVVDTNREKLTFTNNVLCFTDGRTVKGLNTQSQILWNLSFREDTRNNGTGGPTLSTYNNDVYYASYRDSLYVPSYLFKINIKTGAKEKIFTELPKDSILAGLDPPLVINKDGKEIAYFQSRKYSIKKYYNQADVIAYNITDKKILWRRDSLDRYGFGSANPILYENGKIYYASSFDINCLDATNGKMIWRQSFEKSPYQFNTKSMLLTKDGLVVKAEARQMGMVNKETGAILWQNYGVGSNTRQMTYYKGNVIFINAGTGNLQSINLESGLINFTAKSPYNCRNSNAYYGNNEFIIDPKTNYLYICDNYFYQCFKLPN